jgi:hypothetical protein
MDKPGATSAAVELELEAEHELYLPWQAGSRIWRSRVVVVVVEIYRRANDPEGAGGGQITGCLSGCVNESEVAGIAKLNVVEHVEPLHRELHRQMLSDFCFFAEREIDLPGVQSTDKTV